MRVAKLLAPVILAVVSSAASGFDDPPVRISLVASARPLASEEIGKIWDRHVSAFPKGFVLLEEGDLAMLIDSKLPVDTAVSPEQAELEGLIIGWGAETKRFKDLTNREMAVIRLAAERSPLFNRALGDSLERRIGGVQFLPKLNIRIASGSQEIDVSGVAPTMDYEAVISGTGRIRPRIQPREPVQSAAPAQVHLYFAPEATALDRMQLMMKLPQFIELHRSKLGIEHPAVEALLSEYEDYLGSWDGKPVSFEKLSPALQQEVAGRLARQIPDPDARAAFLSQGKLEITGRRISLAIITPGERAPIIYSWPIRLHAR
jgi:hypothetical protein